MKIVHPRFVALFLLPNLIFGTVAFNIGAEQLIRIFNSALLALSIGVCVAYHRPVLDILFDDQEMERSDWLALGIFMSWLGNTVLRMNSIAWRAMGRPDWFDNTHIGSYGLFMVLCAASFHLAAPGAIGTKRVPTERWVRIGALIALGVFASILAGYLLDWLGWLPGGL